MLRTALLASSPLPQQRPPAKESHPFAKVAPARADGVIDCLLAKIESLTTLANRDSTPRDKSLARRGYRHVVCGGYLVFYKVLPRQVRVYRVLHGKRAYRKLL